MRGRVTGPTGSASETRDITGRDEHGQPNAQKEASPPSLMIEPLHKPSINPERTNKTMNDHEIPDITPETAGDAAHIATSTTSTGTASRKPAGAKRVAASLLLALGLLTVGGAAIVNAASPDPSATPTSAASSTPSTTTPGAPGTNGTNETPNRANCPNM
jgi:hypothetical protein